VWPDRRQLPRVQGRQPLDPDVGEGADEQARVRPRQGRDGARGLTPSSSVLRAGRMRTTVEA
jgi:hypothetical protein